MTASVLPSWSRVLVVVAHPDDESFGLGAVISAFVSADASVSVLCFTHGEASTLHGVEGALGAIRARELTAAAHELGVTAVHLLDYPDSHLDEVALDELTDHVVRRAQELGADGILAFDTTGITGHPDHVRATQAAVTAAHVLGVDALGWTIPAAVAQALRTEVGADFVGRGPSDIDIVIRVDRVGQRRAVDCHPSQAVPGSALWRRLELAGDVESLRWLVSDPLVVSATAPPPTVAP